jgi:hypothetical protein
LVSALPGQSGGRRAGIVRVREDVMWMETETQQVDTKLDVFSSVAWEIAPSPAGPLAQPQPANDSADTSGWAVQSTVLPAGALAVIHKPGRSVISSGKARAREWVMSFQPCSAQFIEPLMGWCGGDDPLRHVELRFPSRQTAIEFAQRHGIPYEVSDPPGERHAAVKPAALPAAALDDLTLISLDTVGSDVSRWSAAEVERAILDPARMFRDPFDVVADPDLTAAEKRKILKSWEWDALRIEATQYEAPFEDEPSRLEEVRAALRALDSPVPLPIPANVNVCLEREAVRVA